MMDKISQKPEQNQELCKFLCSSEQGTNPGTVGTLWATGEEARELEHPHSSPRKGHGVSACGGGKYSIKPPGSCCCCSGCVPHCAPGVAIDWPWAAPAAPSPGTASTACPCSRGSHLPLSPLCCDILTPQGPEALWPLPSPAPSHPEPSRSKATPGIPTGASRSRSAVSCLSGFQSCTCLESN